MSGVINALIRDALTVAVSGHVRPDGDCVGACLGLWNYLRKTMPQVRVDVYLGTYASSFSFMNGEKRILHEPSDETYDLFISLDAAAQDRLDVFEPMFERAGRRIVIDHHETNRGYGEENLIEGGASSTCELLYTLMDERQIDRDCARCLYLGIVHDTGVFKYPSTTLRTMTIAGRLLEKMDKGDAQFIIDETFYMRSFAQNKAIGLALESSYLELDGKLIIAAVTKPQQEALGLSPQDLDGVIDQLRITKGTEAAAFLYALEDDDYKVSLRSQHISVSGIAASHGGGGHEHAAGFGMKGPWQESAKIITAEIKELIDAWTES
ncbi:MAG: DHH family phosphoesterase [Lachnospiraceae bacterium]|nr:DHH family phosphoesterase [Lachnospiraceae bacterium]